MSFLFWMNVTVVHHTLYIFLHCPAIPYVCQLCRPFCQCYLMVSCVDVCKSYMVVSKALFNSKMSSYLHRTIWMWRSQRSCLCGDLLAQLFDGRLFSDQPVLWILPVNIKRDIWTITAFGGKKKATGQTRTPSLDAVLWNCWHLKCILSIVAELISLE